MTVGDQIVRDRRERLASPRTTEAQAAEILSKPAPRSISREQWPPSQEERRSLKLQRNPGKRFKKTT